MSRVLLYGATGLSGRLLAEELAPLGDALLLAGRDAEGVAAVAAPLGLAHASARLEDPQALDRLLDGVSLVLHCAGPFRQTAAPMMAAAIRAEADYLDLSGEWPVFAHALGLSATAEAAGVMLMPGVGFSIVASDCLAALAAARVPDARRLRLATSRSHAMSRGSAATMLGLGARETLVCRDGRLARLPAGSLTAGFDFGAGRVRALAVPWPDLVTAPFSTGIADIETYAEAPWTARLAWPVGARLLELGRAVGGAGLPEALGRLAGGTSPRRLLAEHGFTLVAEVEDRWRRPTWLRLDTTNGYAFTTESAAAIVHRVRAGDRRPGFQTPSRLLGADFVLTLEGARLDDAPLAAGPERARPIAAQEEAHGFR